MLCGKVVQIRKRIVLCGSGAAWEAISEKHKEIQVQKAGCAYQKHDVLVSVFNLFSPSLSSA